MSDVFYVVSRETADSDDYIGAVAFNSSDKDVDNEATANEYLTERKIVEPWRSHSVMSADDFASFSDPDKNTQADAPTDDPKADGADAVATD